MIHLRIVAPTACAPAVREVLNGSDSVCNVVHLPGVAGKPEGDLLLCDVAREDASVIISDLKELGVHASGSIVLDDIEAQLSAYADEAEERASGAPSDAVVWEEVEARTSESTEISGSFVLFMVLAGLIASIGIYLDSAILIVGAMVVGPEFGPIAGICVAAATRRRDMAIRSSAALTVGLPAAMIAVFLVSVLFRATGVTPQTFSEADHDLSNVIASPDFFAFFVAVCAGIAGIVSLSTAKSGALIGVLISVTTIPAAANVGIAAAYGDWGAWAGSLAQLGVNLAGILLAGTATLLVQRRLYRRRRIRHLADPARRRAGLPVGRSARAPLDAGAE